MVNIFEFAFGGIRRVLGDKAVLPDRGGFVGVLPAMFPVGCLVFLGVGVGFGVAVEEGGAGLEEERKRDPDLPVGEGAVVDGETAGPLQVGHEAPAAQGECEDRKGRQQGGSGDGGAPVADALTADFSAFAYAELNDHPTPIV